jgi:hypothetical protein
MPAPLSSNVTLSVTYARFAQLNKRVTADFAVDITVSSNTQKVDLTLPMDHTVARTTVSALNYTTSGGSNGYITNNGIRVSVATTGSSQGSAVADVTTSSLSLRLASFLTGTWSASGHVMYELV